MILLIIMLSSVDLFLMRLFLCVQEDVSLGECEGLVRLQCHDMSQPPEHQEQHQHQHRDQRSKPPLQLVASSSPCSSNPASPTLECPQPVCPKSRRTLKNEDSSYDSDFESSDVQGQVSSSTSWHDEAGSEQHEDVCRTVSDTLGAEFAEYVTIQPNTSTTPVLPTATNVISAPEETVVLRSSSASAVTSSHSSTAAAPPTHVVTSSHSACAAAPPTHVVTTSHSACAAAPLVVSSSASAVETAVTSSTTAAASTSSLSSSKVLTISSSSPAAPTISSTHASALPPQLAAVSSLGTVTVTSIVAVAASSSTGTPSVSSAQLITSGVSTKLPLTAAASLPVARSAGSSGQTVAVACVDASVSGNRPSSAPVTHTLSSTLPRNTAPAAVHSKDKSAGHGWADEGATLYQHQVEFGIKLGYSESLVQLALEKLGEKPAKNELLDELIRLGAGVPRLEEEKESSLLPSADAEDGKDIDPSQFLRPIIIDGSNVAMR